VAAELARLLRALSKIAADSTFVHFREGIKFFRADWMVEDVASIFVDITQLV
jgi:hypothetical protein